jgi:hypothetical protein
MVNKTYILSGLALLTLLNNNKNKANVSRSEKQEIESDRRSVTVETLKNPNRVSLNGMIMRRAELEVIDDTKQPNWYPTYFECSQPESIAPIEQGADDQELIELEGLLRNNAISLANDQKMIIIRIEPGMMITWDNKCASHFVAASSNASRTLIGPFDENLLAVGAKAKYLLYLSEKLFYLYRKILKK